MNQTIAFKTIPPIPYPEPKQFYRRLEEIFQNLEPAPARGTYFKTFLNRFTKDLAFSLGTESIQLYERSEGQTLLMESWGVRLPDLSGEIDIRFNRSEASPWFGEWDQRMVAVVPADEKAEFVMAFFTQLVGTSSGRFFTGFSSFYSALHYMLIQHQKRMEMQGVLEQARSIQMSLLPSRNPSFPGYDIAAKSVPATVVGGDVFDFKCLSLTQLTVTIGDASGHGFAAALQARDVITGLRLGIISRMEMTQLIQSLNQVIHQSGLVSRFVSLVHGELFSDGVFRYVNAGHPRPLLFHDGNFSQLDTAGMILGPNPIQHYTIGTIPILPGDILLMFTDGVIEHLVDDGTEFGIERLKSLVQNYAHLSAEQIVSGIFDELRILNPNFHDDATVVCLKRPDPEGRQTAPTNCCS